MNVFIKFNFTNEKIIKIRKTAIGNIYYIKNDF